MLVEPKLFSFILLILSIAHTRMYLRTMNTSRRFLSAVILLYCLASSFVFGQNVKIYDETIDPFLQITQAVDSANKADKFVICQLGGNWCPWCLRFAKFIEADEEIRRTVSDNFVYIHVNYKSRTDELAQRVSQRLGNAGRFGFPVLVILNPDGSVMHIQNSAYLEEGQGYDRAKVLDFFRHWTPSAVRGDAK